MTDPILLDFPESFVTERLLVRAPQYGDGTALKRAIDDSLPELQAWMDWAQEKTVPEHETYVRQARSRFLTREDLVFFLFLEKSNELIGATGLHRINWEVPKFEIGYWLSTRHSGNGYMTEAVEGLTEFAFDSLGALRIEIRCDHLNHKSAAVARRVGFPLEATFKADDRHHLTGEIRDTLIFAKVRVP